MNHDNERKAFEEWYEKHHNGRQISCDYVYEDNSYSIGYANAMWISWQASASRQGYKLVLEDKWGDQVGYIEHLLNLRNETINKVISGRYKLVPVETLEEALSWANCASSESWNDEQQEEIDKHYRVIEKSMIGVVE